MKYQWSRTSIAWLVTAAIMFVVAFVLTQVITATEGGLIERGAKTDNANRPVQIAAIYEQGATFESAQRYYVNYGLDDAGARGTITFVIPPDARPVLVISNLVDDNDCTSPRSADTQAESDINGGGANVSITKLYSTSEKRDLYFVTPAPSDRPETVTCTIAAKPESETFTSRVLTFLPYAPAYGQTFAYADKLTSASTSWEEVTSPVAGLDPLPRMRINYSNIAGARDIHFVGGYQADSDVYAPEAKRFLVPGEYSWVFWDDLYSQQMRDIALIVIGTLIGIGVTVMIEGLRPFIESLGKSRPTAESSQPPQSGTPPHSA